MILFSIFFFFIFLCFSFADDFILFILMSSLCRALGGMYLLSLSVVPSPSLFLLASSYFCRRRCPPPYPGCPYTIRILKLVDRSLAFTVTVDVTSFLVPFLFSLISRCNPPFRAFIVKSCVVYFTVQILLKFETTKKSINS